MLLCSALQENEEGKEKRFAKRRKFSVLISYSGKGYMGMQKWVWCISNVWVG